MITEDYVSFETAKLLKEKGFDAECDYFYADGKLVGARGYACNWNYGETFFADYKNECSAPTLQLAMKWLREVYKIQIEILAVGEEDKEIFVATKWVYGWRIQSPKFIDRHQCTFISHEQACESAINYCLENLI